jgi:hypothetical protein
MFAINAAYISAISNLSYNEGIVVQFSLALLKQFWDTICVPYGLDVVGSKQHKLKHKLRLSIINNVGIPCIATVISSKSCFGIFFETNSNSVINVTTENELYSNYSIINSNQFIYSKSCASAMFTAYIPVLFFRYAISGVIIPIGLIVVSSSKKLLKRIPLILRPIIFYRIFFHHLDIITTSEGLNDEVGNAVRPSVIYRDSIVNKNNEIPIKRRVFGYNSDYDERKSVLFDSEIEIVALISDIFMLLTFGVACPILALAISAKMIIVTFMWRLVIGRHMHYVLGTRLKGILNYCLDEEALLARNLAHDLERAMSDAWLAPRKCFWIVIGGVYIFWACVFYDFYSDESDFISSLVLSICVVAISSPLLRIFLNAAEAESALHWKQYKAAKASHTMKLSSAATSASTTSSSNMPNISNFEEKSPSHQNADLERKRSTVHSDEELKDEYWVEMTMKESQPDKSEDKVIDAALLATE